MFENHAENKCNKIKMSGEIINEFTAKHCNLSPPLPSEGVDVTLYFVPLISLPNGAKFASNMYEIIDLRAWYGALPTNIKHFIVLLSFDTFIL